MAYSSVEANVTQHNATPLHGVTVCNRIFLVDKQSEPGHLPVDYWLRDMP